MWGDRTLSDKERYEANQLFNVKYLIYNVFTIEQLKELQIDVEEAIVNKE